jgi:23S rRNA (uracil1939-C5)-methyltransferase
MLTVYALAYGGEGIAKHKGMVVFIPGALPGDEVRVRILRVKKRFARGEMLQIIKASSDRIPPFCSQAGICGGCTWQQLAYSAQLKAKQSLVENVLQHIGRLKSIPVHNIIKAASLNGYRHKIQIPFQGETGKVQAMKRQGQVRHLVIRLGLHTREILAMLVTGESELPRIYEFAEELHHRIPEVVGVVQNINPAATNVLLGPEFKLLAGRPYYYEEIRGIRYRISAPAFFQINPCQLPSLAEAVLQAAALSGRETVVDLFCGVGFLTLELARHARMVLGIESVAPAIEDALANKHLNDFSNVDFIAGDAGEGVTRLRAKGFAPEVVVLDPPRKGCEPRLLQKLLAWAPRRIVYISCNPVALARDLAGLAEGGYQVNYIQPLDMFPHTYHVESVTSLTRKK